MRWPWQRLETRQESSYMDTVIALLQSQAAGESAATVAATAAMECASGLVARAFASAEVGGPGPVADALTPEVMATIGRSLVRRGQIAHVVEVRDGEVALVPCESFDIVGGVEPEAWRYRVTLAGPSKTRTMTRIGSERVVHCRYAVDPRQSWYGIGPIEAASLAGRLSANVARALGNEAGSPTGQLLPVPRADGEDATVTSLKSDLAKLAGGLAVVEDASDQFQTGAATPGASANWQTRRLGGNPPESMVQLADQAFREVLAACGLSPALFDVRGGATGAREAWRQALHAVVAPLGRIVEGELRAKLHPGVSLSWDRLMASDLSGRARAFQSMVGGGMDVGKAAALAGLMESE